jgi:p70 ribosomal S6 kinase
MHRSASVAEMRSPARGDLERGALGGSAAGPGPAPSFETNALHRPRANAPAPHLKRAGHAIPHASSIADLQAMQAAQGARGDIRTISSRPAFLARPESDGSPSGSRSPSRLGLQRASRGEDVEMADGDEPLSFSHARPRTTPDDGYSLDGTSVALVSETVNVARKSLFGEGRFPTLPAPRRDADASQYRLLRELGRGLCGTVYLAEEKLTGRIVAFKVMRKTKLVDVGEATHASEERRLHERVSSGPFINRLLASFQDPWALFLVLEYAPCGDLFQAMNFHGLPSRFDATVYAAQVAIALSHLHALGYVYRDLKPENILLHPHGSAQLADFGMAKRLTFSDGSSAVDRRARGNLDANTYDASSFQKRSDTSDTPDARTYTICGTAQYMSPEVLLHRGCRFEADLWALGIFVYELVTGDTPFSVASGSRQELYRKLMSHDPESMEMPASVDEKTASLVRALLKNDERNRLGAGGNWDALFTHRWFGGLDVDAVRGGAIVPKLSPRRRNVITDPALRKTLDRGDAPWRRGAIIEDAKTRALFDRF